MNTLRPQSDYAKIQNLSEKLAFINSNRAVTAPPKQKFREPRLQLCLKKIISQVHNRGSVSNSTLEEILKLCDRKQTSLLYDLPCPRDENRIRRARKCIRLDWGNSLVLPCNPTGFYANIKTLLCPITIQDIDTQVIKTHVKGQYIVHDEEGIALDSTDVLKNISSLLKETTAKVSVFRNKHYIEVTSIRGYHTLHLYPAVTMETGDNEVHHNTKKYLVPTSSDGGSWELFKEDHLKYDKVSTAFHETVIVMSELRLIHRMHLSLEEILSLTNTALTEHALQTQYYGELPLHHAFNLVLRLLSLVLRSTRVVRHPITNCKMFRKCVRGRSSKRDCYISDMQKVCSMFNKMHRVEEYQSLFPTPVPTSIVDEESESESESDYITEKLLAELSDSESDDENSIDKL